MLHSLVGSELAQALTLPNPPAEYDPARAPVQPAVIDDHDWITEILIILGGLSIGGGLYMLGGGGMDLLSPAY